MKCRIWFFFFHLVLVFKCPQVYLFGNLKTKRQLEISLRFPKLSCLQWSRGVCVLQLPLSSNLFPISSKFISDFHQTPSNLHFKCRTFGFDFVTTICSVIKASEMLVAPRISEYFLKFWNSKILTFKIFENLKFFGTFDFF